MEKLNLYDLIAIEWDSVCTTANELHTSLLELDGGEDHYDMESDLIVKFIMKAYNLGKKFKKEHNIAS